MNIYEQAIEKWGPDSQVNMAIEECAELITALRHYARGKATAQDVCKEVADVKIMMRQMGVLLGPGNVDREEKIKLARLSGLIAHRPKAAREG